MSILLNRNSLLKKENLEVKRVDLGKDEYVFVRQMTGRERDLFEQSLLKETKNELGAITGYDRSVEDFRAKLAVVTVCDDKGVALLKPEDYPILSQHMSAKRLEKIVNVAQKLNNITEEDKEALVKNSEAVQDGSSNSDSVEN